MKKVLLAIAALAILSLPTGAFAQATATPGKALKMVFVPKFLGTDRFSKMFEQAHRGAEQAAKELQNPSPLQFLGPTPGNSVVTQIEIVTKATAQGVNAIMMSNNSGDQIVPALKAAHDKGIKVVTWDSPVPSAEGEDVYVCAGGLGYDRKGDGRDGVQCPRSGRRQARDSVDDPGVSAGEKIPH